MAGQEPQAIGSEAPAVGHAPSRPAQTTRTLSQRKYMPGPPPRRGEVSRGAARTRSPCTRNPGASPTAPTAAAQAEGPGRLPPSHQRGAIPARQDRSGHRSPPARCHRHALRTATPAITARVLPGRPRESPVAPRARPRKCTLDSAAHVKPEHAASAARPWPSVESRRLHRPSWRPHAVRYTSVDPATQRSIARQGDTPRDREEQPV